jgi:hypothetical protein
MEVNISFQSRRGRLGSWSTKQTEINSNPCLTRALQRFLIAGHLCHRSQITRPDLLNQQVSRQLLILPTTIHTQITTNQLPNKGVVSFQLHFSEQLQSLKSAQQEGASSLSEGNENSSCNQPECNQRYCMVEIQSGALQIAPVPAKEQ